MAHAIELSASAMFRFTDSVLVEIDTDDAIGCVDPSGAAFIDAARLSRSSHSVYGWPRGRTLRSTPLVQLG